MTAIGTRMHRGGVDRQRLRALGAACLAHVVHDGYMDLVYVLLPLWKVEFGLGYAALGLVRAILPAAMAGAQIPVDRATARYGARASLVGGTLVAAAAFALAGASTSLASLCVALALAGLGSSTQHPRASAIIDAAFGAARRGPLGIYNFAGDIGKATFPALTSLLLLTMGWHSALVVVAAIGAIAAAALAVMLRADPVTAAPAARQHRGGTGRGFELLFAIGVLDTATRMGFLSSCRSSLSNGMRRPGLSAWAWPWSSSAGPPARRSAAGSARKPGSSPPSSSPRP